MTKLTLQTVLRSVYINDGTEASDGTAWRTDHCCKSDDVIAVDVRVRRGCNAIADAGLLYMPAPPLVGWILDFYA